MGLPIVLGVSRKSFLGAITGETDASRRIAETQAAVAFGCTAGADVHRVHDVGAARRTLQVAQALRETPPNRVLEP